ALARARLAIPVAEHPFLDQRRRLELVNEKQLRLQLADAGLDQEQMQALDEALATARVGVASAEARTRMCELIEARFTSLARVRQFWNGVGRAPSLTAVGEAIAFCNAKRSNPLAGLGSLEEYLS